jgi:hypothetical protein
MWLLFNSAIRSPCYLQSLTRLPALPHYLQKFLQSTCTHMLPTLDINLLPTPVTGHANWVRMQVTVAGNGQWHAEGKKILGRWARKNLHLFSCLGLLISLLDTHYTIYTTETWHLWSKNVARKRKTMQRTFSPNIDNEWAITTVN